METKERGKIVAYLARKDRADVAVRGGVGPNAGHTVMFHGKEHKTRMLPSALVSNQTRPLIGPGVLINVNVPSLKKSRISDTKDRTFIDPQCGIIDKYTLERDTSDPNLNRIGEQLGREQDLQMLTEHCEKAFSCKGFI